MNYNRHVKKLFSSYLHSLSPDTRKKLREFESIEWNRSIPVEHQPTSHKQHRENFRKYSDKHQWLVSSFHALRFIYAIMIVVVLLYFIKTQAECNIDVQGFTLYTTSTDIASLVLILSLVTAACLTIAGFLAFVGHCEWTKFYKENPIWTYKTWYPCDYAGCAHPCDDTAVKEHTEPKAKPAI